MGLEWDVGFDFWCEEQENEKLSLITKVHRDGELRGPEGLSQLKAPRVWETPRSSPKDENSLAFI